jgi:murein DD-endopeptidase MepM/ murein hydrolase activator NlpD
MLYDSANHQTTTDKQADVASPATSRESGGPRPEDEGATDPDEQSSLCRLQRALCSAAASSGRLLAPHRRAFLKDLGLLALSGYALYDRSRRGAEFQAHASAVDTEPRTASAPSHMDDVLPPRASFIVPISGFSLRDLPSSRLPNARRQYRQGVHEGLDLYVRYGNPVRAAADGIVTRADLDYMELAPELHERYLAVSRELETTPPDILDRLRGRCIEIDHGLHEGVRCRSVYGHLSRVLSTRGESIRQGELIGDVGNSGTTAGVRGCREEAHLHLEIRFQRIGSLERFVGEGLTERETRQVLEELFRHA